MYKYWKENLQAEGLIDGRALVHELNWTAGIRRNVANGDKPTRQVGRPGRGRDPGRLRRQNQRLRVRDGDEPRRLRRPVDTVDDDAGVGRVLVREIRDVAVRVLFEFVGVVAAAHPPLKLVRPGLRRITKEFESLFVF